MMDVPIIAPLVQNRTTDPPLGLWASQNNIESFAILCIENKPRKLDQYVADLLTQGAPLEDLFLYLLAPAARHMGELWRIDHLSFVDVQLGLCRLHQLVCECESIGYWSENVRRSNHSILLTCVPGEDHTFGIAMVADFFRRYGWQVSNLSGLDKSLLFSKLASTHFNAIGFSLHNDMSYGVLKALIDEVRLKSVSENLIILVGGDFFVRNPHKVDDVGADFFANDGKQAVLRTISAANQNRIEGQR